MSTGCEVNLGRTMEDFAGRASVLNVKHKHACASDMGCKAVKSHLLVTVCCRCQLMLAAMVANCHCNHNKSSVWLY